MENFAIKDILVLKLYNNKGEYILTLDDIANKVSICEVNGVKRLEVHHEIQSDELFEIQYKRINKSELLKKLSNPGSDFDEITEYLYKEKHFETIERTGHRTLGENTKKAVGLLELTQEEFKIIGNFRIRLEENGMDYTRYVIINKCKFMSHEKYMFDSDKITGFKTVFECIETDKPAIILI